MKKRRRLIIAALTVSAFGITGIALGAAELKTEKETKAVSEPITRGKAKCEGDRDAISGGYRSKSTPETTGDHLIRTSRPTAHGWKAATLVFDVPADTDTFTTFAYCRNQAVSIERKVESVEAVGEAEVKAKAKCPAGKRALSGGFATSANEDDEIYPSDSKRAGKRGWNVFAREFDDVPQQLTAYVVCGEGSLRAEAKTKTVNTDMSPSYERFKVTAKCHRDERVVSGGFSSAEPLSKGGPFFDGSLRTGERKWTVYVLPGSSRPR